MFIENVRITGCSTGAPLVREMEQMSSQKHAIKAVVASSFLGLTVLTATTATAQTATDVDRGRISGVWLRTGGRSTLHYTARERAITDADDQKPPLRPEAAALLEQRLKDSDEGRTFADSVSQCLPGGVPKTEFFGPYPMQIITEPGQISILFEELNHFRVIPLNAKHNADPDPSYWGDSVGRWEGDTLVVDTVGFNDRTTLDAAGTPHSDALHVIERFRRVDRDTLEITAAIDDPKTFTKTWTAKALFKSQPGVRLGEYICDNNRNVAGADGQLQGFSTVPLGK